MKTKLYKSSKTLALGMSLLFGVTSGSAQDGSQLFQTNCAACHKTTDGKLVGPGMAGITEKRSTEWLKTWIKDSQAMIASGDPDAKAISAEYNNMVMPPFTQLSGAEMDALITYLGTLGAGGGTDTAQLVDIVYTDVEIAEGKKYFTGEKSFFNGGPSCISCHDVSADGVIGGYLAKDLTDVYTRLGEAGILAMIANAPFPAMNAAYKNNPVSGPEQKSLAAFLKSVSANQPENKTSSVITFLAFGFGGFFVLLILIMLIWNKRKKHSVKEQIFARQIRSIN
ncbi:MAG: c-type cytochrome [Crocinitomicaceae bacterium]|nr:c-type cytochrome [Crocinitomicaceae bacterium]